MNFGYISLGITFMAGLSLAAGMQHGFNALLTKDREDQAFAVACFSMMAMLVMALGYNNAADPAAYRRFYQAHAIVSRPFFILWAWLLLRFAGFKSPWPYRIWIGAEALKAVLLLIFIRTPYFFDIQGIGRSIQPWGEAISYPTGRATALQFIQVVLPLLALGFSLAGAVRLIRHRRPFHGAVLVGLSLLTGFALLFDNLSDVMGWPDVEVAEFSALAPVLFLGWLASQRLTEAAQALRRAAESRQEVQRLEALGTLAGGMAHEFNNVLMAVNSQLELASQPGPPAERDEALRLARLAAGRGREIIRRILDFARNGDGRESPRPLAAAAAVEEILQLLRPLLPSSIRLSLEDRSPGAQVLALPGPLQQALLNLGLNAGQAIGHAQGSIRFGVDTLYLAEGRLPGRPAGEYVELRVEDDGPGMEEAVRQRIFEPFYTTKAARQGSGLGLAVVHGLITRMGGWVDCESRPGLGTTFRVLLPAAGRAPAPTVPAPVPAPEAETPAPPPAAASGAEVMVLDDEAVIGRALQRLLQTRGYRAEAVHDPHEALNRLRREPGRFHVLITDMSMPDLNGEEVLREAKRLDPALKVILSTGSLGLGGRAEGFDGCLEKPYTLEQLEYALRTALDGV